MKNYRIVFLVSGNGGTLKFFHYFLYEHNLPFEIISIVADRQCGAVEFAKNKGIPHFVFEEWYSNEKAINSLLMSLDIDFIITTIQRILKPVTVELFRGKLVNLHYSLLPAYGCVIGMKTIELAKTNNAKIIGTTCHFVDENLDAGQIISQGCMRVDWNNDYDSICNLIFQIGCITLLNGILTILSIEMGNSNLHEIEKDILYSPKLKFNSSIIQLNLWQKIKYNDTI